MYIQILLCMVLFAFVGGAFLLPSIEETIDSLTLEQLLKLETDPSTDVHSTGFVRTDKYDWLNDMWLEACSVPVGECINSETGGLSHSHTIDKILLPQDGHFVLVWKEYNSSDCQGKMNLSVAVLARESSDQQVDTSVRWIESYEEVIKKDPRAGETVVIK